MVRNQAKNSDASKESFLYQLEILKMEMQGIEKIVSKMDDIVNLPNLVPIISRQI
jgi:hypothetical protein